MESASLFNIGQIFPVNVYVTMSPGWLYNKPDLTIERNYTLFGRHDTRKAWPTQLSMILCTFWMSENFR